MEQHQVAELESPDLQVLRHFEEAFNEVRRQSGREEVALVACKRKATT
ncbi:MAG: hypothetical protein M1598_00725 [Actinobacteria bacterium]|nr:hypothetical protein [Actinomycetota bacterium]